MSYVAIKIIHSLAAVAAMGPLMFAPWMSTQLKHCREDSNKALLLKGIETTDTYYNVAGWILILSGVAMFWMQDWHRVFQLWFILSVVVFGLDSLAEKRLRDPAIKALMPLKPGEVGWSEHTGALHRAVMIQMVCTAFILLIMLLYSQHQINLLNFTLSAQW